MTARTADGRLAQVRVLEFATHGLVAGDVPDLAQPALAFAAGAKPEDESLLASEAAGLKSSLCPVRHFAALAAPPWPAQVFASQRSRGQRLLCADPP